MVVICGIQVLKVPSDPNSKDDYFPTESMFYAIDIAAAKKTIKEEHQKK
jgi:hypothetical protein